ncbi:hypothetical protein ACTA71_010251 [Dictyostelium dimigraforme]
MMFNTKYLSKISYLVVLEPYCLTPRSFTLSSTFSSDVRKPFKYHSGTIHYRVQYWFELSNSSLPFGIFKNGLLLYGDLNLDILRYASTISIGYIMVISRHLL